MKIVVFGASGGAGKNIVEQALQLGHHVTAFVRSPPNATGLSAGETVEIILI